MRALLSLEADGAFKDLELAPRVQDYLSVLDERQLHDPDNALYDYLAALQLWNKSARYEAPKDVDDDRFWILIVEDQETFEKANDRFSQAQSKPFLAIGEQVYKSIVEFLAKSTLFRIEQAEVAVSRLVTFRQTTLFIRLVRWQDVRAEHAVTQGDKSEQTGILLQNLRLFDQAIVPQETSALTILTNFGVIREHAYQALKELIENDSILTTPEKFSELTQHEEDLRVVSAALKAALQLLHQTVYPAKNGANWPSFLVSFVTKLAATLLIGSGIFLLAGWVLSPNVEGGFRLSHWQHLTAWAIGMGLTFVVFGMAPAEMIDKDLQKKVASICLWLAALLLVTVSAYLTVIFLKRYQFRFRVITLLASMIVVAVFASLWPFLEMVLVKIIHYAPELWMPARGWYGFDPDVLLGVMKMQAGTWTWALMQWHFYSGVYIGLAVSLILVVGWAMLRGARQAQESFWKYWTDDFRSRWGQLFRLTGMSAFTAALCWLLLYLLSAPHAVQLAEAKFQYEMKYCRDPLAHWTEIHETQEEILSSEGSLLRGTVKSEMSGEEVEMDFTEEE
jgi:hypothetical protein